MQENEPAWPVFISEVRKLLGVGESYAQPAVAAAPPQPSSVSGSTETGEEAEALSLISGMDDVCLGRFSVVPGYAKFDEVTRNVFKDARQKLAEDRGNPQVSGRTTFLGQRRAAGRLISPAKPSPYSPATFVTTSCTWPS